MRDVIATKGKESGCPMLLHVLAAQLDASIRVDEMADRYLTCSTWAQDDVQAAIVNAGRRVGRCLPTFAMGARMPDLPRKTGT